MRLAGDFQIVCKKRNNAVRHWGFYADLENIKGDCIIERNGLKDIEHVERLIGAPAESVMWYPKWRVDTPDEAFPRAAVALVDAHGAIPHLVWEACRPAEEPYASSITLHDIADGHYDSFVSRFAEGAAAFGRPLFVRFLHEFNGGWYSWGGPRNGYDTALYVDAWRRVVSIARESGASNIHWTWSPNAIGGLPEPDGQNAIERYWPGDEFVDWIALDGYNFYPFFEGPQPLRSFDEIFRETYERCAALTCRARFMIGEFASGEYEAPGTDIPDKSAWIDNMFETLEHGYERLEWLFWFHVNKERDWRLDSSPRALEAFRRGFARQRRAALAER